MTKSLFTHIPELPEDPILGLAVKFKNDPRDSKIDLSIGVYRDEDGHSKPMKIVSLVEKKVAEEMHTKVYLPIDGDPDYLKLTAHLVMGKSFYEKIQTKVVKAQAVGGTSALSTFAQFFSKHIGKRVWVSKPTWPNHLGIFKRAGCEILEYPYYDHEENKQLFEEMIHGLQEAKENDCILLHGCCHNPSGKDLTADQWKILVELVKKKKLFPLFDFAYQGFGQSLEEDRKGIEIFLQEEIPMAIAVSHSKNFGLYADRIGALFILADGADAARRVLGVVKSLIRTDFSNPPKHGSLIISTILKDEKLENLWKAELKSYQKRIEETREHFISALISAGFKNEFSHLKDTLGMFCFTGLSEKEVAALQKDYAIYMTSNGRINVTGLNKKNQKTVVDAILQVKKLNA